jgi:hypothetical protein
MKSVKVFCMQKDEADILERWIIYHAYIFGLHNLHIADNFSTDVQCHNILRRYTKLGLNVRFEVRDFKEKGNYLMGWAKTYGTSLDIFIPIDIDEFVGLYRNDSVVADRDPILNELSQLPPNAEAFSFRSWLFGVQTQLDYTNIIEEQQYFVPCKVSEKRFFRIRRLVSLDRGFHSGKWRGGKDTPFLSNLVLLHFHFRSLSKTLEKARNVVRELGVSDTDWYAMRKLRERPGEVSRHKISYLLRYHDEGPSCFIQSTEKALFYPNLAIRFRELTRDGVEKYITRIPKDAVVRPPPKVQPYQFTISLNSTGQLLFRH